MHPLLFNCQYIKQMKPELKLTTLGSRTSYKTVMMVKLP